MIRTVKKLLVRFVSNERGNIALLAAAVLSMVMGFAALGVDVGKIFTDRRKMQSTADLAAMVAAGSIGNATNAATATLVNNSYTGANLASVELGTYTANASLPVAQRFVVGPAASANAVRVKLQGQSALMFGKILTGKDYFDISAAATATSTAMASFAIGSRLASLNGGLLNAVLGSMLGTTLSLSVMDYDALINARVDAFAFLGALATRLNLTGVTYDSLLSGNVKVPDVLQALLAAPKTNGQGVATAALTQMAQAASASTVRIALSSLIDVGPYSNLVVGQASKASASLSVFDVVSAVAQLANGTHQVAAAVNLNLPGIAGASLVATIGERPTGTSWVTVGLRGASVHTAQTRILLSVQLIGSGVAAVVNLPLYVEVATGTATLDQITCGYPDVSASTVTLGVKPGVVDAWIGNVSAADLGNFTSAPSPSPAVLVNVLGVTVSGRAHAAVTNMSPKSTGFTYSDIAARTKKTVSTTAFTSSLTASLLGDLNLSVSVGLLSLPIPGLGATVSGILSAATSPVDQLLAAVLQALGIGLGQADVWVSDIRCDGAVLVN